MPVLGFTLPLFIAFLALAFIKRWIYKPSHPFPPGPKPLPVIGNLLDMPPSYQWRTFVEWKERWGEPFVVYVIISV